MLFTFAFVMMGLTCINSGVSITYGFNVWLSPLFEDWYGNEAYSMDSGCPNGVVQCLMGWIIRNYVDAIGPHRLFWITQAGIFCGLVFGALAVYKKQMWLLYIGLVLIYGISVGSLFCLGYAAFPWFITVGRRAFGTGLLGFIAGVWPALFGVYCGPLVDWLGVAGAFLAMTALLPWPALFVIGMQPPEKGKAAEKQPEQESDSRRAIMYGTGQSMQSWSPHSSFGWCGLTLFAC